MAVNHVEEAADTSNVSDLVMTTMCKDYFDRLGNRVLDAWSDQRFDHGAFAALAYEAFSAEPPNRSVNYRQIIEWIFRCDGLPRQVNLSSGFGQPPVTMFWHAGFYIEVLFWTTATTSIHQHGFAGAFHVLEGSSLESRYEFSPHTDSNGPLVLGELRLLGSKRLRRGDTEAIEQGPRLIHSVFHLDVPSVTIVIRTHGDNRAGRQYSYIRPHVAIDPFHEDPVTTRRLQTLGLLERLGSGEYCALAAAAIDAADLYGTFKILERVYQRRQDRNREFDDLVRVAEQRHGHSVAMLRGALEQSQQEARLIAIRQRMIDPEQRFILSLVLALGSYAAIVEAVRQECPSEDPDTRLVRFLGTCRTSGLWHPALARAIVPLDIGRLLST